MTTTYTSGSHTIAGASDTIIGTGTATLSMSAGASITGATGLAAIVTADGASSTFSGGTATASNDAHPGPLAGIRIARASATISGGTYTGQVGCLVSHYGTVAISAGTFVGSSPYPNALSLAVILDGSLGSPHSCVITGGTFDGRVLICIHDNATVEIRGGTFTSDIWAGNVYAGATLTIFGVLSYDPTTKRLTGTLEDSSPIDVAMESLSGHVAVTGGIRWG